MLKFLVSLLAVFLIVTADAGAAPLVKTGAQILFESGFHELAGKRVGLVTNHTALVEGTHLIDLLAASGNVHLTALFAPEHGLRGLQEDGAAVAEGIDARTGLKVFSLYGRNKKPTPAMLANIDLLLFDIQDIGARFYTFISTMGLAMQAAAEAKIPFVVLDRPNPLGGDYIDGPLLENRFRSFVGLYPIPVAHGMTVGELALMIKGEHMLPGLEGLDLRVVKMEGWQRWMQWPETGLPWVRTSPNIPDFETALLYAGFCFLEATSASEGRGTLEPFRLLGFPMIDNASLAAELNNRHLHGIHFEPAEFTPKRIAGMSSSPKFRDRTVSGLRLTVTDRLSLRPVETCIAVLSLLYNTGTIQHERFFDIKGFDRLAGSDRLRRELQQGRPPEQIISGWQEELQRFAEQRKKYLLY